MFSSPRMENVERVAQLLREAGIETRITHGRSYKGGLRGEFSYRDHVRTEPVPAVWVVLSEDQPAARDILRTAGLLDSTRRETGYTLPAFRTESPSLLAADPARKRATRLKLGLLFVITVVIVLVFLSMRKPQVAASSTTHASGLPMGDSATPDSLAVAVLAGELPTRADQSLCLEIDGHDPSLSLLAALPASPGRVIPVSRCAGSPQWMTLAIRAYRRTGNSGSIVLDRKRGAHLIVTHHYDVRPEGAGWRVIEPYHQGFGISPGK
ncbi:MAG: hypothetical protein ABIP11_00020 [Luteimonas sp.]